ncbi:MAG: UPF0280 family protein [Candidatus Hodarchaeota archaeon]
MKRHYLKVKETIATVIADEEFIPIAENEIRQKRQDIEKYILQDSLFEIALDPYDVATDAPEIVKRMAAAGKRVGVGPMSSVAGAIAQYALEAMVDAGAEYAIFDNGGDIAMYIDRPLIAGIYAGGSRITGLGLKFLPRDEIFGLCTSSATVGHSLSFGMADAATVISKDVILADAVATALGNLVTQKDDNSIKAAMKNFMIEGIEGMITIIDDKLGMCGKLPEIVKARVDYDLITKG